MIKIKDRIVVGALSGFLSIIPIKYLNAYEYRRGWTDETYMQSGSSLLLPEGKAKAKTLENKIIGSLVHNTMTAISGSFIAYMLSITGRDMAMFKGAGFSAFEYLSIWGVAARLGLKLQSKKPMTYTLSFLDHVLFGAATAKLISKLGDDSLFPDLKAKPGEKLPIIPMLTQKNKIEGSLKDETNAISGMRTSKMRILAPSQRGYNHAQKKNNCSIPARVTTTNPVSDRCSGRTGKNGIGERPEPRCGRRYPH
ncbi:MAG: hypothetical protein ACYCX4_12640 [Bacillota bacterium]